MMTLGWFILFFLFLCNPPTLDPLKVITKHFIFSSLSIS